jgi:hypothetical protein
MVFEFVEISSIFKSPASAGTVVGTVISDLLAILQDGADGADGTLCEFSFREILWTC